MEGNNDNPSAQQTKQVEMKRQASFTPKLLNKILIAGTLMFGGGEIARSAINDIDSHGPAVAASLVGKVDGSSQIALGIMDRYSTYKIERSYDEQNLPVPEQNPEFVTIDHLIQDAVEQYQKDGKIVKYAPNPNRKPASHYFDLWAKIAEDISFSDALKYRGFSQAGKKKPDIYAGNFKIITHPINPLDRLKQKSFSPLGEFDPVGKDVGRVLLFGNNVFSYEELVGMMSKFGQTDNAFYRIATEALTNYAKQNNISPDEISESDKDRVYAESLTAYMKDIYGITVQEDLPQQDDPTIGTRAPSSNVLRFFLSENKGDLQKALDDTTLYFKILTRLNIEDGQRPSTQDEWKLLVKRVDGYKDSFSIYGRRFGLSSIEQSGKDYFASDYFPDTYAGSPQNIVGQLFGVYSAASLLYYYPPDVVAMVIGMHIQAEAGPDSRVQSLDKALNVIRQLERLGAVDKYFNGLSQTGVKEQKSESTINTVRDRLQALSRQHSINARHDERQASIQPRSDFKRNH